jgi:hypothetical protein
LSEEEGIRRTRLIGLPAIRTVLQATKEVGSRLRLDGVKARAVSQAALKKLRFSSHSWNFSS